MPENIQERMRALIVQHDNALAALAALWQQPEAQQNVVYGEVLEM
jgi:Zn-finger domain-containing protein